MAQKDIFKPKFAKEQPKKAVSPKDKTAAINKLVEIIRSNKKLLEKLQVEPENAIFGR